MNRTCEHYYPAEDVRYGLLVLLTGTLLTGTGIAEGEKEKGRRKGGRREEEQ